MSLPNLPKVQAFQAALHDKAKRSPSFRFYSLYDKVCREDVLWVALKRCQLNDGAPGVDRQTFADIAKYGEKQWLDELAEELRKKTYCPSAVRRVWFPKPDGKLRPLGIPTIKDRVVQTAVVLVLEPIFEADLQPEQYAYRAKRSALDAVNAVHRLVSSGQTEVVDADLSGYFDSIPHAELMTSVARRVSDSALLHLLKMWLTAPVEETDSRGRTQRTTRNRDESRGTPQGAPLSPLLSNLYMRRFVLGWKTLGHEARLSANIVNYADDFVICCRGTADEAMSVMRRIMGTLKLTVNETKTRIARLPDESFDFLGYTIGRVYRPSDGSAYLGTRPSRKKLLRFITAISERTVRSTTGQPVTELVTDLNQKIRGWANYFRLGSVSKAYHAVNRHACSRLRQWLCSKHQLKGQGYSRYPDHVLHQEFGLVQLTASNRRFSHANS